MPAVARALTNLPYPLTTPQVLLPWVQGERPAREGLGNRYRSGAMTAQPLTALPKLRRPNRQQDCGDISGSEPGSRKQNR